MLIEAEPEAVKYPKVDSLLNYENCTKTATIKFGAGLPMTAMVRAIEEFGCYPNLDRYHDALCAIDKLEPDFARIYGYEDIEKAKDLPLIVEFSADGLDGLFVMLPAQGTEELVRVDEMPLFKKKSEAA